MVPWWFKLIVIVFLQSEDALARCIESDQEIQEIQEIQGYLKSSKPPFDNYHNISRAVYPLLDLPSMIIKITVEFLSTADGVNQNSSSPINTSTASVSSKKNESDLRPTTNEIRKYTWSMSCLYVSAGPIDMASMNVFSLWAIWPNRRERRLHLTLPQLCTGAAPPNEAMFYILSTLQDITISPGITDPSLNTMECVIAGHEKAPAFPGSRQLLNGVCWCVLCIAIVMSTLASQWVIVQLRVWQVDKENNSKIVAIMVMSVLIFFGGLGLIIYACILSHRENNLYVPVFFVCVLLVLFRRVGHCLCIPSKCKKRNQSIKWDLTSGHDSATSKNAISFLVLYPAVFMAVHHLLWIVLGILTEPFWAFTILVVVISVSVVLYFLISEFHKAFPSPKFRSYTFFLAILNFSAGAVAFVLLMFVLLVVAQASLGESLIATIVQNGLVLVVATWFRYLKLDTTKRESEGQGRSGMELQVNN